jgi:hypothetical protein
MAAMVAVCYNWTTSTLYFPANKILDMYKTIKESLNPI